MDGLERSLRASIPEVNITYELYSRLAYLGSPMKHRVSGLGRRIDLNLMVVFDAVYESRSLTRAGERLGLSQPAVSHSLARLRNILGDPLFLRSPRGVIPTLRAEEVAPGIAEGLGIIRASFEERRFDPATSTRLFTVGMADVGEVVQLPLLVRTLASAPGVRLRTLALSPEEVKVALAEGQMDLALSNFPARRPFREEILGTPGYATVVRKGHPLVGKTLTIAAFRKARHVLVKPVAGVRHGKVLEKALNDIGAQVALEIGHFFAAGAIVAQTDFVSTVPWGMAKTLEKLIGLRAFTPPVELPVPHLSIMWHERYDRDPGNAWLRANFVREMRALYG